MTEKQITQELSPCKVIVIDDEKDEALPLIRALSERDIPILYYNGEVEELPKNPNTGVRIVFLDMQLAGMKGLDPKNIVSSLMGMLKKVVSMENGPYIILAWTKHGILLSTFQKELAKPQTKLPKPCFIVDMEKGECKTGDDIDYEKVSNKLAEKLSDLYIFDFLVNWEKTISSSSSGVISLINSMSTKSDRKGWTEELEKILYNMAKAQSGKHLEDTIKIDDSTTKVLNSLLKDFIEKNVVSKYFLKKPSGITAISDETRAKINTTFHVKHLENPQEKSAPGNLYFLDFPSLKNFFGYLPEDENAFKRQFFDSPPELEQIKLCMLEITPICDYTNKKWKCNRFIIGIIVPNDMIGGIKNSAKFLYTTPLLSLEGDLCYIVFNFHYVTGANFEKLAGLESKYQFRMDLLSYIQSKMSNHITRRGIFSL